MMTLHTAYYNSPVGMVKIMSDEQFITGLVFAENENTKEEHETNVAPVLQQCIAELEEYFNGERTVFTIPLSQSGTLFQQQVWKELVTIPFGKTVSYLALSKRLGDVKAIRAAAAANGKNKISILVPCHRVVGSDQSLVGYAWGNHRKQWLLQHEAKYANGVQTLF